VQQKGATFAQKPLPNIQPGKTEGKTVVEVTKNNPGKFKTIPLSQRASPPSVQGTSLTTHDQKKKAGNSTSETSAVKKQAVEQTPALKKTLNDVQLIDLETDKGMSELQEKKMIPGCIKSSTMCIFTYLLRLYVD
jgi:hypothetical protein